MSPSTSPICGSSTWVEDSHYLVWTPEGIEHVTEREEVGAFTHVDYLDAFRSAELDIEHDPVGLIGRGLYIGEREAQASADEGASPA